MPHPSLNNAIQDIGVPFRINPVIGATDAFVKLVEGKEVLVELQFLSASEKERYDYRILYAYKYILQKCYGLISK